MKSEQKQTEQSIEPLRAHLQELDQEKYRIALRKVKKNIEIYREKNIPLLMQLQTDSQKYGQIAAGMMVKVNGEEVTMQKANSWLKDRDREKR